MADPKSRPKETNKLKARLPRGLADRGPAEIAATRAMLETIRGVYERYGFEPVETPAIEYTDALGKFLPDQDRPNEGVFSFKDDDEQWLSLRYDLTAPLARYVAENFDQLPKPYRSYREGWVFRNEKPGPGRFRQFMQFDADTVGAASMAADAEICMMAADTMEALGIPRGSYVVKVNNRKVLDGVLEAIGLGGDENAGKRLTVLRAIDKLDRLGVDGVRMLLGPGRKDESGDFTKGAGLISSQIEIVLAVVAPKRPAFHVPSSVLEPNPAFPDRKGGIAFNLGVAAEHLRENRMFLEGITELDQIRLFVESAGYGQDRILIDQSVVRGLEYYTGPVFEVELTFSTDSADGSPRFGSVGGGGRYDGLVARFRSEAVPATGFSVGVSRLLAALTHLGKIASKPAPGPVIVTVFDKDRVADYQRMASTLRQAGIRAELYLGSGKFGAQMKYADRRRSPCVVIQGTEEKQKGEVQIKDLIVGAELAGLSKERDDYLKKQAQAQFAVPENRLVEAVREVLARHGAVEEAPDLKEVFAHFGQTAYMANVLEVALVHTLLQVEFMTNLHATVLKNQGKDFNRAKYESEFDEYYERQLSKTMGHLVKRVEEFPDLNEEIKQRIKDALARRNHLTHNYWREQAYAFQTAEGRAEMIAELSKDTDTFEKLASDIMDATQIVRKRLGISEEKLNAGVERQLAELQRGMVLN